MKSATESRSDPVNIRPLQPADKAEWFRLRWALWDDYSPEKMEEETAGILAVIDQQPVFVAERPEGGLCGLMEVAIHESAPGCRTNRIGYLEAWYVDPEWRGRGIGRRLVETAEAWSRSQGCTEMASDTDSGYPLSPGAHNHLGYETVEIYFRKVLAAETQRMEIDIALVGRLVAAQFPAWADLPIRPVELSGWDNRTFHLGEEMTVRLPSAERYTEQVDKEHHWLPRLAPLLPLPIPLPLALGVPGEGYPWHWSIYRWIAGENATIERIADLPQFATSLAQFLAALQKIDPADGPPPGTHNFYRGGLPATYDAETRRAIETLDGRIDADLATEVWEAALQSTWRDLPVWVHGDFAAGNLLLDRGRLSAVIDFGCSAVGDPACDLTIAWTLLSGESRDAFRAALPADSATWARGRGWALWKGLITLAEHLDTDPLKAGEARRVIDEVLADHNRAG